MIDKILQERGSNYGDFYSHAALTQRIKNAMKSNDGWQSLGQDQKEALEMIAHKIGRIINGNPTYKDSWVDIEGYAALVSRSL